MWKGVEKYTFIPGRTHDLGSSISIYHSRFSALQSWAGNFCCLSVPYAKLYIQAGGDPFRLQKLLGHSDLSMTRKYVALYSDDLKANYDALNPLEQMTHNTRRDSKIKLPK